jgi:CheY-like chemotaxis protein
LTQPQKALKNAGTVLVVDDEPMVRSVVCRMLEEWDFKTVEASSANEALEVAGKFGGELSMVVTDVLMPFTDGYAFARSFRSIYPAVPILFMTAASEGFLAGKSSGRNESLIFKPFDSDSFLDAVAQLMQSRIHERRSTA